MRPLSAIDAIGPAWDHTSRLLFAPRNWRLVLKIGAVAFFAQAGGCNGSFNSPGHHMHGLPPAFLAGIIALAFVIGIVAFIIGLVFFYLGSRLQFVLFEIVLRSDTTVSPIWQRYGRATWHWMALKIIYFLVALLCVTPILIPVVIHFIRSVGPIFNGGSPQNPAALIIPILGLISTIFLILIVIGIGYSLLRDFGLPSMALESTSISETVRRVWNLLRDEPGPVLLYLLMRFLLVLAGTIAADVALVFCALITLIPLGGAALLAWLSLRHTGPAGHVAMIGAWIILGIIFMVLLILAAIMLIGYVFTFEQAYALYFLGGRYPQVGVYLDPFLPPPYAYPGIPPNYPPPPPINPAPQP